MRHCYHGRAKLCVCRVCVCVRCSHLYQIAHLGDDDGEPEYSSAMQLEEGETFFFAPRALKNLVSVDELESLSPIMACQVRLAVGVSGEIKLGVSDETNSGCVSGRAR